MLNMLPTLTRFTFTSSRLTAFFTHNRRCFRYFIHGLNNALTLGHYKEEMC